MKYNKLVRDGIPAIILSKGEKPKTRKISGEELYRALFFKLHEEIAEFAKAKRDDLHIKKLIEELADISEVIRELSRLVGSSPEEVERARQEKEEERGGFSGGIFLEETE